MEKSIKEEESNHPDHYLKSLQDSVYFIGELEHVRRHARRSAITIERQLKDDPDNIRLAERLVYYGIVAEKCKEIRRKFMEGKFQQVEDEDWCLLKSSASLQQLVYELFPDDKMVSIEVEAIVDMIWSQALGMDMSGCKSCKEDRDNGNT